MGEFTHKELLIIRNLLQNQKELGFDPWEIECEELVNLIKDATDLEKLKNIVKLNFSSMWEK